MDTPKPDYRLDCFDMADARELALAVLRQWVARTTGRSDQS